MIELIEIKDQQDENKSRVAVADYLEKQHGVSFKQVSSDYEKVSEQFGLSGNPVSDYQQLKKRVEAGRQAQERMQRYSARAREIENNLGLIVTAEGTIVNKGGAESKYDAEKFKEGFEFLKEEARMREFHRIAEKSKDVKGFWEVVNENKGDLIPAPMAGMMDEIQEVTNLLDLATRYREGQTSNAEELDLYRMLADQQRKRTIMGNVGEILTMMPQFMADIASGSALYGAGRKGTQKVIEKTLKKETFEALQKRLIGKGLLTTPGIIAGTATAFPVSGSGMAIEEYQKAMVPEIELRGDTIDNFRLAVGDDPKSSNAAKEAIASTYIELLSERTGGAITGLAKPIKDRLVKTALGKYLMRYNPTLKSEQVKGIVDAVGFNGILGEMFEERFADVARYATGLDEELHVPDANQLAAELIAFSVPAGAFMATGKFLSINKFLDPESGITEAEWKAVDKLYPDADVLAYGVEKYDDPQLAGDMVKAKKGDSEAQNSYIERATVDPEESIEQEAGLSGEEIEAFQSAFENDTSALPEEFYIEQEREMDEVSRLAALDEAQNWFESIQGDDQSIERNDDKAMPFMNKVNDLAIEQGWTQNEKDAYINQVLEAASSNAGRDLSKMADKLTILGESTVDFVKGVAQYKTKLYKGATVFDLVEEEVEGYAKRYLQEGTATYQEFIDWKRSIEEETGEKTHSDTERGVIEWLSSQGQGWYLKNMQDQEALNRAPASFLEFIQRFIEKLKAVFRDANLLRRLDEEGKLNKDLKAFLDRALGFDENYLQERFRQAEMQDSGAMGEELMDVVKELGGVPRPDSDPAYRGELETYFESIGKNWKSLKKEGGTLDGMAESLRERGFENMQTPDDVIEALMAASRGEKIYSNTSGQMQGGTFSIKPIDKETLDAYFKHHDIPAGKQKEATDDLQETFSLAEQADNYPFQYELDLSGAMGGTDQSERSERSSGESKAKRDEELTEKELVQKYPLRGLDSALKWKGALLIGDGSASSIIPELVKDTTAVWDVKGALIRNAADIAALARMMRSPYFESFKLLLFDKDGVVLRSSMSTIGTVTSSLVHPSLISRELAALSKDDRSKVAGFAVSHNHPSGDPAPSHADIKVTRQLMDVARQVGIPFLDHVITNGKDHYSFYDAGVIYGTDVELSSKEPKSALKKLEKLGIPPGELAGWEIEQRDKLPVFNSPEVAENFRKELGRGNFIFYLDRKNKLAGIDQFEMPNPESTEFQRKLFDGAGRNGATAIILALDGEDIVSRESLTFVRSIREFGTTIDLDILDVVGQSKDEGFDYYSYQEAGLMEDAATYSIGITETPEFKKWFGNSKVVDKNGKPLVVYHGSPDARGIVGVNGEFMTKIEAGYSQTPNSRNEDTNRAYFFTSSKMTAATYADEMRAYDYRNAEGAIVSVYLSLQNPMTIRSDGKSWGQRGGPRTQNEQISEARKKGHDGLIIRNTIDTYNVDGKDITNVYIAFDPTQIKSAISNQGTFDPNDPRISYSIGFEDDGIDPKEFARERTPEEMALAQKLRELRNFDLTQKERKKLQEEAKVLQVKAVESRKRQRLQNSATKKLAAEIERRVMQIKSLAKSRDNLEKAVKQLEDLLSKLPKGVKARFNGYGQLASRKTIQGQERYVEQATNRIEAILDKMKRKQNRDQLLRLLGTYYTDYGPNRRKLRQRVGERAFDELYFAASLLRKGDSPAPKTIDPERADMLRNVFGSILIEGRGGNPARLADAVKLAEDILKGGRNEMDEWNEARKARNERRNNRAIDTILKGEDLKTEQQLQNERKDRSKFKRSYDTAMALFFHPLNGLQQMMNLLDGKKGGAMEKYFSLKANQSDQKELSLNEEHIERTREDLLQIFDGSAKRQAQWFKSAEDRIDTGIMWVSESGKAKEELTRLEMVDVLAQWDDPTLKNTFYNMKVRDEDIEKIRELATPYGVKLAQYIRKRYAEVGIDIQATFKETEGFAMDLVEGYGGRVYRAGVTIDPDDTMFGFGGDGARATVKSASMKERVDSVKPVIFSDAFAKFERHMREANHYITHAQLAKDFFATFRSRKSEVRKAIKQRHGDELLGQLDSMIDDIIRGRLARENKMYHILNGLRANVTKASLAIKPAVAIKQLTSPPAYIEEIGFREYSKAFIEFSKDPMRWMREVYNTEYVRNRLSNSFYADIQDQIKSHSEILGKASITDALMLNVKLGDIGAVIFGGAPVYLHTYKKAKTAGKSDAAARLEAEDVFIASSERAQQSSAMASRGSYLRDNAWTRTWFMYMTSPIQYQRNVNVALYNLVQAVADKNKGNRADVKEVAKQALRAVLIFHVILPQIFQAVASGFLAFTDDDDVRELFWKRQLQTLVYGNMVVFPIVGQVIESLTKMIIGNEKEIFDSSGSPLLDLFEETKDSTMKAFEDGDSEDWMHLGEDASKFFGLPMETVVDNYEALKDVYNNDTDHPILRLLGWSEWALGEKQ